MISTISKKYNNINLILEVEYTGPNSVKLFIEDNLFSVLPEESTEENYTLSLPEHFEELCLIDNLYSVKSVTPSTMEYSNGKSFEIKINSLNKQLVVEQGQLSIKDMPQPTADVFVSSLESYKNIIEQKLSTENNAENLSKLQTLLEDLTFVIDGIKADKDFPYQFYEFPPEP